MNTQHADTPPETGLDAVRLRLHREGVLAKPMRRMFGLLVQGPRSAQELIRSCGLPKRTVEELIELAGLDVTVDRDDVRLAPGAIPRYRDEFGSESATGMPHESALELIESFIATGPAPSAALDHVTATPDTALRRAEWLRDNYELPGARMLLLGDHDLTSLATCLIEPGARVTVVDVDERILAHIDGIAAEHRLDVHTLFADLRFGLPPALETSFDLVFTDPPYTPEGVGLFAASASECMADANSRLLLAYGFSPRSPALGHKVQQELLRLGMVFEAIVAGLNHYEGAQAIGSRSDLYVCQPTARSRKKPSRRGREIYTHGPQSVESSRTEPDESMPAELSRILRAEVHTLRAPFWQRPISPGDGMPVFDLRADPGPWLLRMLLACNADRAAFLVANRHPDITSEHAQTSLSDLLAAKYKLRYLRSSPDPKHAVVLAESVDGGHGVAAYLLHRAHGKLANIWREALITASDAELTKREAAERVNALTADAVDLGVRLIDLPRHRLTAVLHSEGEHSG